jgi:16S rRNA processing protein RimM
VREKELVEYIARGLVEAPEEVSVREVRGGKVTVLELKVNRKDMGRVIGKDGRVANAMRTLLRVAAQDSRVVLEIDLARAPRAWYCDSCVQRRHPAPLPCFWDVFLQEVATMTDVSGGQPRYLAIGSIVGVHGIRGELKVLALTDYPERFRPGQRVFVGREPTLTATEIVAARPHHGAWLVKLASVADRNVAETFRDQYLLIPESEAMPLAPHENYVHDLLGITVVTDAGEPMGALKEVLFTAANDVYVIAGPTGEILIPALRSVVLDVDL